MLSILRRITPFILVFATVVSGNGLLASAPALASSGPVFTVMNTDSPLPDGVWFRNSPHTADTSRITADGVYAGDRVQLNCYAWGDAVGPYNDTLWYDVTNLTRPTVPSTGKPNVGYLNAHYINDGKVANQVDAGVYLCGAAPVVTPVAAPAPALAATVEYLLPDGSLWCYDNAPFGAQVLEDAWAVQFTRLLNGDTTANDAKCQYGVSVAIPTFTGSDHSDEFLLPPYNYDTNVNWASACAQQFPGSTLKWEYFTSTPWQCVAPAGRYYPPPH